MDFVCVPFRGLMGKTKDWSVFERSIGARHTGLSMSRIATQLALSRSTVSCVYQEWSTNQRTSSQLETTVGSIGVNMGPHPCGMLSPPCSPWPDELRLFWGKKVVQLNIRKVFLMFCTFIVCQPSYVYYHQSYKHNFIYFNVIILDLHRTTLIVL